eukprot:scaffold2327_cov149-Amphora_coffeaeformis.AAC.4
MRKSNKQRRISQDQVVSASLEAELLSLLYDNHIPCTDGVSVPRKRSHVAGDDEVGRLHSAIQSHQCLFIESESIIKQAHGMLVLKLSELSRKGEKFSNTREALACLEALYGASSISKILDDDEKLVVTDVLIKILRQSPRKEDSKCVVRLCLSNMRTLFTSPTDWQKLQLVEFRDLLIGIVTLSHREQAMDDLQIIVEATEGFQQKMAATVKEVILAKYQNSWDQNENDYLNILQIETQLHLSFKSSLGPAVVDKLVKAVSTGRHGEYAAKCLALAAEQNPDDTYLFDALLRVLLHGETDCKQPAILGIFACISGSDANVFASDFVSVNLKSLIIAILQVIQSNSHHGGKTLSSKSTEILGRLFSDGRKSFTDLPLADMVSICAALLDNPHVDVSSFMCTSMLNCLSSFSSEYGPLQLEAIEIIAKFTMDRHNDDPILSRNVIEYYSTILKTHGTSLMDLPRVPCFVESIVKIANCNWERRFLREPCLRVLVQLSETPLNQRRLARIGGIIPLLIKQVREMEENGITLATFSRDSIKSCIQTLAAAI